MRFLAVGVVLGALASSPAPAQMVISAHSGVVQYVEGRAYLDEQPVEPKFGHFPELKQGQEFRTEEGRAEILLTPGVFLRLGENSSIRMLSNQLEDTRVEITSGDAMVECEQIPKDNAITLVHKNETIRLVKHGLYRLDAETERFQVYDGEAIVANDAGQLKLKGGKRAVLGESLVAENFDKNADDELYRWANRRASYVAQANVYSAAALSNSASYGYSSFGYSSPGWQWNPFFGMFTWVPLSGIGYSPFGYSLWSPTTVFSSPLYYGGVYGRSGYGGQTFSQGGMLRGSGLGASRFPSAPSQNGSSMGRMGAGGASRIGGGGMGGGAAMGGGGMRGGGRR